MTRRHHDFKPGEAAAEAAQIEYALAMQAGFKIRGCRPRPSIYEASILTL
jgi:hypothetical protein